MGEGLKRKVVDGEVPLVERRGDVGRAPVRKRRLLREELRPVVRVEGAPLVAPVREFRPFFEQPPPVDRGEFGPVAFVGERRTMLEQSAPIVTRQLRPVASVCELRAGIDQIEPIVAVEFRPVAFLREKGLAAQKQTPVVAVQFAPLVEPVREIRLAPEERNPIDALAAPSGADGDCVPFVAPVRELRSRLQQARPVLPCEAAPNASIRKFRSFPKKKTPCFTRKLRPVAFLRELRMHRQQTDPSEVEFPSASVGELVPFVTPI